MRIAPNLFIPALLCSAAPALAQPDQPPAVPPTPPGDGQPVEPPAPPPAPPPPVEVRPPEVVPVAPVAHPEDGAPLQFRIGSATITPIGFMDFTGVWRSHDAGSGIGTNFASIPYGTGTFQDALSETRLSMQNSRVGFRVDAMVHQAHVLGYMESDFLGNNPGNVAVSSNSNTLRSRLYFVDVRKHEWELLAGQAWSLITPGRTGISPLPSDLFYTQDIDVNYQAGLVWARNPELRVAYHPTNQVAVAIALDNPEQYVGGSAGGSTVTFPAALAASYPGMQLDNGTTTLGVPNVAPDVIAKLAIDPNKHFHVEIGGVERQFSVFNPTSEQTFSATGLGGFLNFNAELVPGLRLVSNNFWSAGGGRYIFGQVPDLIANADGSISLIHTGSTVSGLEYTMGSTMLYGYYGAIYVENQTAPAVAGTPCTSAMTCVGYGYTGSPAGQNKDIQEETVGFNQTFWKDPRYGALNLMGQYSHVSRDPWFTAVGAHTDAHESMVFFNLRYTLPGTAPKMPY